ncbi:PREDICTED: L-tryptophan--pyruvate aminotransferase 1-like [Erythranthe guttata]|uniref:L-tryptophan--pyruvate aminotransferase 1-like n=1 Tax=Erythranthe guttata TaxID=4155 RepID=UPI00064DB370|nr:PREDICTED: L-tryptophan--pyruvate aminotransferase 1-like [Erythranthe guttata]|eukprot:XP_012840057.1 PREDICTED: L-tryptophan--pyruvate aminotransferase 1-like [Erythranthe guttata]
MVKSIEVSTIGVSKEAQNRAATILEIISLSCCKSDDNKLENFFEYSHNLMAETWKKLREAIKNNKLFHVAKFPNLHCNFTKDYNEVYPAFAWMKCNESEL